MSGVGNYSRQRLQDLQSQDEQGYQCRWCSGRAAVISVSHSVSSLKSDQTKQRKTEDRIPTALVTSIRSLTFTQKSSTFGQGQDGTLLARIFHELPSRDRGEECATGQPQGVGSETYLNSTSQGPTREDARKDGHVCGRSRPFMKYPG
jgi:hypothetical protein